MGRHQTTHSSNRTERQDSVAWIDPETGRIDGSGEEDVLPMPPSPKVRVTLNERLAHFTWAWFSTTLATGAMAVILGETPNRFRGLYTIGKVFFILDLLLFITFTILIASRFIRRPQQLWISIYNPAEGLFFGAYWVSICLILQCTQYYGVPSCGPGLIKGLEVCFWMYAGIALVVAVGQYYVFFQEERLTVANAMPAWIFPIYPILTIAQLAGALIPSQPPHAAFPMWIGAVMLQGLAWAVAFLMYSTYMQRLMTSTLPPPSTRPGMYVSVGPAGYTASGLVSLGAVAPTVLPGHRFEGLEFQSGDIICILGILCGSFIVLFAVWFSGVSTIAVFDGMCTGRAGRMHFTLNWWAFIFPNAGLASAAIELGKAYESPGINGICSALTVVLVVLWLLVAIAHIRALFLRQILWPGKDEDKDMMGTDWSKYTA